MKHFYLIVVTIIFFGCSSRKENKKEQSSKASLNIKYATGFKITPQGTSTLVEVTYPYQGATSGYQYLLVPKGQPIPEHKPEATIVRTPLEKIVCTSTTHIPLLDYLGETNALVGFPSCDYVSSEKMRARIDSGKVAELGIDKGLNLELLTTLQPDVVMGYTMTSDYGQFKKVEELGLPVVINAEYLEQHPLGRAEWIKFMAVFFGKEREADSIFTAIEKNYLDTKAIADTVKFKPHVLSGIVYGDAWFMPGGQNYASKILKDAGCDYLWGTDSSHGFLQLSFESVYEKAHDADMWIGTGTFNTLKEIAAADQRYAKFKPFQRGMVYTSNAKMGAKGGSEYLELGYLRPDIILKDLVKIGHPQLLPDHALYFHRKLV
jgi:iron complex transport system substrate-binding protein